MATPATSKSTETGIPVTKLPIHKARSERLPLRENNAFQYWLDPSQVVIANGAALYQPTRINITPGVQNVPGDGDPGTSDSYQKKQGRILIPLDFEVQAWGKKIKGYMTSTRIGYDRKGKEMIHYHEVWRKFDLIGTKLIRSWDADGFADFCKRIEKLAGGAPHEKIEEAERDRLRLSIVEHRRQAHRVPGSAEHADTLEQKLTASKQGAATA